MGDPSLFRGQGGRAWLSGLGGGCSGGGGRGRLQEWLLRPGRAPHYPGMCPREQWVVITQPGRPELDGARRRRQQDSGGGGGGGPESLQLSWELIPHPRLGNAAGEVWGSGGWGGRGMSSRGLWSGMHPISLSILPPRWKMVLIPLTSEIAPRRWGWGGAWPRGPSLLWDPGQGRGKGSQNHLGLPPSPPLPQVQ